MSVQFTIAKPADWIEIFGDLLNGISGEKPFNFLKPELSDFVRKGEKTLDQKKNGLPKHSHTRATQLTQLLFIYRQITTCQEFYSKTKLHS